MIPNISLDSEEQKTAFHRIFNAVERDDNDNFDNLQPNIQDWSLAFGELLKEQGQKRQKFSDLRQNLAGSKAGNSVSDHDKQVRGVGNERDQRTMQRRSCLRDVALTCGVRRRYAFA